MHYPNRALQERQARKLIGEGRNETSKELGFQLFLGKTAMLNSFEESKSVKNM